MLDLALDLITQIVSATECHLLQNVYYSMSSATECLLQHVVCYRMPTIACRLLQNVYYSMSSVTEFLQVFPSLDPPLTPHFKSALSTTTLAVAVPVFGSFSQDAFLTVRSSQVSPSSDCAF
jgi:hypothetical protein